MCLTVLALGCCALAVALFANVVGRTVVVCGAGGYKGAVALYALFTGGTIGVLAAGFAGRDTLLVGADFTCRAIEVTEARASLSAFPTEAAGVPGRTVAVDLTLRLAFSLFAEEAAGAVGVALAG